MALFQMPATGGERVDIYPRAISVLPQLPSPPNTSTGNLWARGLRRGTTYRNSIVIFSPHSHLQIGQQWSDQRHLVVLGTVDSLCLQGPFVPISAASPQNCGSSWSGYSLVIMQLTSLPGGFSIYKDSHRMWPRILSTALEKMKCP